MQIINQLKNMKPYHLQFSRFNLPASLTALVLLTAHASGTTPIVGDTINTNLTVTGWGTFANGVDLGCNGELLLNWIPADAANPLGTATSDIALSQGSFLWRDSITPTLAVRNKMRLDQSNNLTLYRSDGCAGLLLDPENGKISVLATGTNSGIFFGTNILPTLQAASNGSAIFPSQVTLQGGLLLTNGCLQVSSSTPATSSSGALTVAGGIAGGMDAYFNSVRVGRGAGNISTNTVNGAGALGANTTGYNNTATGSSALRVNTTGYYNTATGPYALSSNTSGYYNTAAGPFSLFSNTTGYSNTATGPNALGSNTTGYYNTATGQNALFANTSGSSNTATGMQSLRSNTTGSFNTASGPYSLYANTTGSSNTAAGPYALYANTFGYSNTATGPYALYANTLGYSNTATGTSVLRSNTTGSSNTATGTFALYANTSGGSNTASGSYALYTNTTGYSNTALGNYALCSNILGSNNVAVGTNAAFYQSNGSTALTNSQSSIYIGAYVKGKDNNDSNSIVIGSKATGEGANTTVIGNSTTTKTHLYGELVADAATIGGYPVLTTQSGTSSSLTNSATLALGNSASASQQGAIAIGQYSHASTYSALALGDFSYADGNYAVAIQAGFATGVASFAANWGCAGGDYSLALAVGQARGFASVAIGGLNNTTWQSNCAMGIGSVALGGQNNLASGAYAYALGSKLTSSSAYCFSVGSQNLSASYPITPIGEIGWVEESTLLEVGNGNPDAASFETSNAITTLKNGQTTLTNKAWKANTTAPLADPGPTTDSGGNALVVEGHTVLKGKVVIEQAQGDIAMGIYGDN